MSFSQLLYMCSFITYPLEHCRSGLLPRKSGRKRLNCAVVGLMTPSAESSMHLFVQRRPAVVAQRGGDKGVVNVENRLVKFTARYVVQGIYSECTLTYVCGTEVSSIWTGGVETAAFGSRVQPVNEIIHPRVSRDTDVGSAGHIIP